MGKDVFSWLCIFLLGVRNTFNRKFEMLSLCFYFRIVFMFVRYYCCRIDVCCRISYVSNYVSLQPDWQPRKTRLGAKHAKNVGMCYE